MKYERLTTRNNLLGIAINKREITLQGLLDLLCDLEDKIESGELIFTQSKDSREQEFAFFAKLNKSVRKLFADDLKVCLQDAVKRGDITREVYDVIEGEIKYCLGEVEE